MYSDDSRFMVMHAHGYDWPTGHNSRLPLYCEALKDAIAMYNRCKGPIAVLMGGCWTRETSVGSVPDRQSGFCDNDR